MSSNSFMGGDPRNWLKWGTLLLNNGRQTATSLPFAPNFEGKAVTGDPAPAEAQQPNFGWNIKRRNYGGADIAYEIPSPRVDGMMGRALVLGAGLNVDEINKGDVTTYKLKNGANLSAGDLRYQKKNDNGSVNVAINGPGVELGYDATSVKRNIFGIPTYTGFGVSGKAQATILTGEADGRIELPLRKTFNAPLWKIPSNIRGALRGERKAQPGDLKLVLSGGVEGGSALGGSAFFRAGE